MQAIATVAIETAATGTVGKGAGGRVSARLYSKLEQRKTNNCNNGGLFLLLVHTIEFYADDLERHCSD